MVLLDNYLKFIYFFKILSIEHCGISAMFAQGGPPGWVSAKISGFLRSQT